MQGSDAGHDAVKKLAVMRNNDDAPAVRAQIIFEPQQRVEIEMIRGLVEQQHVGLLQEEFREGDTHLPATTKGLRWTLELRLVKSQACQHFRHFGVGTKPLEFLKTMLEISIASNQLFRLLRLPLLAPRPMNLREFPLDLGELGKGAPASAKRLRPATSIPSWGR